MKPICCTPARRNWAFVHSTPRVISACWIALGLLVCLRASQAAPPPNALCANAVEIPADGPFPYVSSIVPDVSEATTTGDPPEPSCGLGINSQSIWYQFTPSQSGTYTFSVAEDTATTLQDTVMALFASPAGCAGPFEEVNCNDDSGGNHNKSAFDAALTAGVHYYVVIWNFYDELPEPPLTAVQLKVAKPVPPANDTCAGALTIPPGGPFPYLTPIVETLMATTTADPPRPTCQPIGFRSTW